MIKMAFTMERLIFGILVIFHYNGVNSVRLIQTRDPNPPPPSAMVLPVQNAGNLIQQIRNSIDNVGQLYFLYKKHELISTNRILNGTIDVWAADKSKSGSFYFKELKNEIITAVVPFQGVLDNNYIVALNLTLRILVKNKKDYTLSKPVITFDEPDFIINAVYCDAYGIMFVLLIGKHSNNKNLGKLYKIVNKQVQFVQDITTAPGDFRFDQKNTAMYMIHKHGTKIIKFAYDNTSRELGDSTDVFDINDYPNLKGYLLTSVVPDANIGHIWVAAAGKEGKVIEINPKNKTIVSITPLPTKHLTFITFAFEHNDRIVVGSKSPCKKGTPQGAIYSISGFNSTGVDCNPILWKYK